MLTNLQLTKLTKSHRTICCYNFGPQPHLMLPIICSSRQNLTGCMPKTTRKLVYIPQTCTMPALLQLCCITTMLKSVIILKKTFTYFNLQLFRKIRNILLQTLLQCTQQMFSREDFDEKQ